MINHLTGNLIHAQQIASQPASGDPLSDLEQRLAIPSNGYPTTEEIAPLYSYLQRSWAAGQELSGARIIANLREFIAADQSQPYKNNTTHMGVLTAVMEQLKLDGGEASSLYAGLNTALGMAVVSDGVLNAFIIQMLQRPDDR